MKVLSKMAAVLALTTCFASNASAECTGSLCTYVTVTEVLSGSGDSLNTTLVGTSGAETGLDCQPANGEHLRISNTDPNAPYIHSLALTALALQSRIKVSTYQDAGGRCHIAYLHVFNE